MNGDDSAKLERRLGAVLEVWVSAAARGRRLVGVFALAIFATAIGYTATHLGIRSAVEALFPEDLPFRIRDTRYLEAFPALDENIVVVLEGSTAESTREATHRLADRLLSDPGLFTRVYLPMHPFFEENGLLFLETDELDGVADRLAQLQPMLAGLVEDESLRGLMRQTRLALEALRTDRMEEVDLGPILLRIEDTIRATLDGGETSLDWSEIISFGGPTGNPRRRVVFVQPRLDYSSMAAAEEAIEAIFEIGREIGIREENGLRLRMTGDMVLNFDEMRLLRTQVAWAGVGSFAVVALLLHVALRSARLALATVVSLVFGLAVTAGFAALAIGHLNMISVAFAVLFIGLGVDFGIHLCMRFQELRAAGHEVERALGETARGVGSSLMLCAFTTAIGFFAFIPTDFIGVAELGVIAGVGMFIGVGASFTIIPAIVIGDSSREGRVGRVPALRLPVFSVQFPLAVVAVATAGGLLAIALLPQLRFDQNPLHVRDPGADSVRVYADLLGDSEVSPWTLDYLAADAAEARRMAARFAELPEVDRAQTIFDYVPEDQAAKLAIIGEMALYADWDAIGRRAPPATASETREALESLRVELEASGPDLPDPELVQAAARLAEGLRSLLDRLASQPPDGIDVLLADLETRLLGNFQDLLERLARAMRARPVSLTDLPEGLREVMVSAEGVYRVEIVSADDLSREGTLDRFVAAGRAVTEDIAGPAIRIHDSARAVVGALRQALGAAIVAIMLILIPLWRRLADVVMVMLPLLWAGLMTGATMVLVGIDFNFADVIVLPLLLGIGVDSGIHMVHRARIHEPHDREALLATSTARAVVFSALTTIASFGSLALVPHLGMASLGQLLVIGVAWTVAANLIVLPALLELDRRRS